MKLAQSHRARGIEDDLVVAPEPVEQPWGARPRAGIPHLFYNVPDASASVDGVDDPFLQRVDRQDQIVVPVTPVQEHGRGSGRQTLLNANRMREADRHVAGPTIVVEA